MGRIAAAAPASSASAARLAFNPLNSSLTWHYSSTGDYDQNGEVNISDLTPLGVHFGESSGGGTFPYAGALSVVDGDGNGEINITDITPIGANFGARVTAYNVYAETSADEYPAGNTAPSTAAPVGSLERSAATGEAGVDRLGFSFELSEPHDPAAVYWVRPSDGSAEGTPSNMAGPGAPIESSIEVFQLDFTIAGGATQENSDWGEVAVTFIGSPSTLYLKHDLQFYTGADQRPAAQRPRHRR